MKNNRMENNRMETDSMKNDPTYGYEESRTAVSTVLNLNQANDAESMKTKASMHFSINEQSKALAEINRAIESNPKDVGALELKAVILGDLGYLEDSIDVTNNVLDIAPGRIETLYPKWEALEILNRSDEAAKVAEQIMSSEPVNCQQWMFKADVLSSKGYYDKAVKAFEKAELLDPDKCRVSRLPRAVHHLNHGEYNQAINVCNKVLEGGHDHETYHVLAEARAKKGDFQQALEDIDVALVFRDDIVEYWNLRGQILEILGRIDEAGQAFKNALMIDGSNQLASERLNAIA